LIRYFSPPPADAMPYAIFACFRLFLPIFRHAILRFRLISFSPSLPRRYFQRRFFAFFAAAAA